MALFVGNLFLAFAWAALTGTFTPPNVVFGFVLGALALSLVAGRVGPARYFRRARRIALLLLVFLAELAKSVMRVASLVLRPKIAFTPALIAFPLRLETDLEIALLANAITLTPGTLSVDVSADRRFLYVHCIDAPDPDAVVTGIRDGFERRILEALR